MVKHKLIIKQQGRLGNQMFEYAFGRAMQIATNSHLIIAGKHNRLDCFCLPREVAFVPTYSVSPLQRLALHIHTFFTRGDLSLDKRRQRETFLVSLLKYLGVFICQDGYEEPPIKSIQKKDYLSIGYFQSERYFLQYKPIILQDFQFKEEIKDSCKDLATDILACESVCLHVRLGDYETIPMYNVVSIEYLLKSIDYMRQKMNNPHFFLFTNDVDKAVSRLNLGKDTTIIPDSYDDQQSLYLGSLCKHHIISNSSYSWWMQYLGQHSDQIVIAPSRWYNGNVPCDLYLSNWVLM